MARSVRDPKLDTRSARAKLGIRREPYWAVMAKGTAIGYRKAPSGGTWIARFRDDDGKQHYQALGAADDHQEADAIKVFTSYRRKIRPASGSASRPEKRRAIWLRWMARTR